ncbi:DUF268 domain-containing protein [Candidatus Pelagibacter sp.]|nr:DUF268 domain-containing protein [Candidatus Pelagibacter sp.]
MKWYKGNKIYLRRVNNFLNLMGLNLRKIFCLLNLPKYIQDYFLYKKLGGKVKNFYPILEDFNVSAGNIKNHLFHADLLTSQNVFKNNPSKHLDIGSRIDGVVAQIASFRKLDVFDIREIDIKPHQNINFLKKDIIQNDEMHDYEKYDSISSIGCIAHVGLGRYGDKIDPEGYKKAIKSISNLSKNDCYVYILTPVGNEGVEFNAHWIFNPSKIIDEFKIHNFNLEAFHLINDEGDLELNAKLDNTKNLNFGGGYFIFKKKNLLSI